MLGRDRKDLVESGSVWTWLPTVLAFLAIYTTLLPLLQAQPPLQHHDHGRRRYRSPPSSGPAPDPGAASALPPDRLGAGRYAGMPMSPSTSPSRSCLSPSWIGSSPTRSPSRWGRSWESSRFPRRRTPRRLWRVRKPFPTTAAVFAMASSSWRILRRRQHPQHPGGRVRLHAQLRRVGFGTTYRRTGEAALTCCSSRTARS